MLMRPGRTFPQQLLTTTATPVIFSQLIQVLLASLQLMIEGPLWQLHLKHVLYSFSV